MKYRIIEALIMLVFGLCLLGYLALWMNHPVAAAIITLVEVVALLVWLIWMHRHREKV